MAKPVPQFFRIKGWKFIFFFSYSYNSLCVAVKLKATCI